MYGPGTTHKRCTVVQEVSSCKWRTRNRFRWDPAPWRAVIPSCSRSRQGKPFCGSIWSSMNERPYRPTAVVCTNLGFDADLRCIKLGVANRKLGERILQVHGSVNVLLHV